ncbi:MAG: DUF3794 domain-containing protein [Clostridia bacterium]|nr:DUF3794 domain-containing protein [Clostridia bacterium]
MQNNGENSRITKMTTVSGGTKEIVSELSLPDYLPDVSRLLRTHAAIGGKSSYLNGQTLEYDGELNYTVVYATSDGRIKSVPLSAEFDGGVALPEMTGDYDAEASIKIENVNCRLQNPRRLSVRTKLSVFADIYSYEETAPVIAGKSSAEDEAHIEKRFLNFDTAKRVCAADENVPISEDLELDAQAPAVAEIVSVTLSPYIGEVRAADGALSYKGEILAEVIYLAASDDADSPAEYYSFYRSVPISGEVDAEGVSENCFACGYATVSAPEFRPQANALGENRVVEIDFSYTARLCALCNEPSEAVIDMYSTDYAGALDRKKLEYRRALRAGTFNFTCDGTSPLDDKSCDKVVSKSAAATVDKTEQNGSKAVMTGSADVSVILTDGKGTYIGRTFSVPFRAETEIGKCGGTLECETHPSVLGAYARVDGGEIKCDVEIGVSFEAYDKASVDAAEKFTLIKDRPQKRISPANIVICYPSQGEELWDVAKRYGISEGEIRAANSLSGDNVAGRVIIIPNGKKKRG